MSKFVQVEHVARLQAGACEPFPKAWQPSSQGLAFYPHCTSPCRTQKIWGSVVCSVSDSTPKASSAGDTRQEAEAVKTTKRSPPSMGWGEGGGSGLRGDAELANPELFTGPPSSALRRHRNVTKDRARGFGPASVRQPVEASSPPLQLDRLSVLFWLARQAVDHGL